MSILRWGTSGGGHAGAFARIVKYPPKKAAKNIASEATNRTIPSTGPLISGRRALPLRRDVAHVVGSCSAIRRSYAGRSERIVGSTSKL
jgi:hypothetical protein